MSVLNVAKCVFDALFPIECLICKTAVVADGLCGECWGKFHLLNTPACARCYKQLPYDLGNYLCGKCVKGRFYVDIIRSPVAYDDFSKKLIMGFKNFCNIRAAKIMAKLMANNIQDLHADYIVAVPLHFYRLVQRGYNQSEMLAKYMASNLNLEYIKDMLYRSRFTQSQSNFSAKGRAINIAHAFTFNHNYNVNIKGKSILLVDDVYTTGSTLEECAKVLKKYGAKYVYAATGAMRC